MWVVLMVLMVLMMMLLAVSPANRPGFLHVAGRRYLNAVWGCGFIPISRSRHGADADLGFHKPCPYCDTIHSSARSADLMMDDIAPEIVYFLTAGLHTHTQWWPIRIMLSLSKIQKRHSVIQQRGNGQVLFSVPSDDLCQTEWVQAGGAQWFSG